MSRAVRGRGQEVSAVTEREKTEQRAGRHASRDLKYASREQENTARDLKDAASEPKKNASRVAVMSIIVEDTDSAEDMNSLLHEYGRFIIGRMGLPYRRRGISIVSVALDAPQDDISALSGKIGRLKGVSVKTVYSSVISDEE